MPTKKVQPTEEKIVKPEVADTPHNPPRGHYLGLNTIKHKLAATLLVIIIVAAITLSTLFTGTKPDSSVGQSSERQTVAKRLGIDKTAPTSTAVNNGRFNTIPASTYGGYNYSYVGGRQYAEGTGASVLMTEATPHVGQTAGSNNHSLMELAVSSHDAKQVVEIGWTVDPSMYGNSKPHLFVARWTDGKPACYNGCGFVRVSKRFTPGMVLNTGSQGAYKINHDGGNWTVWYDNDEVGYFPDKIWNSKYTSMGFVQVFGEVSTLDKACVQMGNGLYGTDKNSAEVSDFTLIGSDIEPALYPFVTANSLYNYGSAQPDGFHLGGPGTC